jgi:dTDP-4-dehydrorhamnose 3,5-epimerase-like enzyme
MKYKKNIKLIKLLRLKDDRGQLTVAEYKDHIPFEIRRIYFISNVVKSAVRGGHAHRTLQQVIIAIKGSFDIHLDDGRVKRTIHLDSNCVGLFVGSMIWRRLTNFSDDAICLVLASNHYDEDDYYSNYVEFINDLNMAG